MRTRTCVLMFLALLALFAGCKGESPTSPTTNPTPPPGGVVPPATGASITLTASNSQPQVDSSSVITATVTQNGSPVPNGTAVEFSTNLGTFTEANAQSVIRTTTNGVATVTLTSSVAGPATVTATVANVSKTTTVTFNLKPVVTPPPDLTPQITSISPQIGRPQGGEILTITGKNFSNAKVIFDFGGGKTVEAFPVSQNSTTIQVLTPSVDLGTGQQKTATIVVINNVGTANEVRVTAGTQFTFQSEVLTPKITTLSPAEGPIEGGTRVTIFGEGFQAPLQVFFGSAEAALAGPITFNQLVVIAPKASSTNEAGSGAVTGSVDVKVINIDSATNVTATGAFRYIAKMQITTISPISGSALGGTDITIDGQGFEGPVTVEVGSGPTAVQATVLSVVGSRIRARTGRLPSPCTGFSGPITVTNSLNGDFAQSGPTQNFTYFPVIPVLNSVTGTGTPPITTGSGLQILVTNPGVGPLGDAVVNFTLNGVPLTVSPNPITTGTGQVAFSSTVPTTGLVFPTVACTSSGLTGVQFAPLVAPVVFTNVTTTCTSTLVNAITIQPPTPNPCVVPPTATVTTPAGGGCLTQTAPVSGATNATGTITIQNSSPAGSTPLNITSAAISGVNAADYTISPNGTNGIAAGASANFTVTFKPTATGARAATATFNTNDPAHQTVTVCLTGTGTP